MRSNINSFMPTFETNLLPQPFGTIYSGGLTNGEGHGRGANGAEFERRMREDRCTTGAEKDGVWGEGVLLPTGEDSGEEAMPPPQKKNSIFDLKMATLGAFCRALFLQFSYLV